MAGWLMLVVFCTCVAVFVRMYQERPRPATPPAPDYLKRQDRQFFNRMSILTEQRPPYPELFEFK